EMIKNYFVLVGNGQFSLLVQLGFKMSPAQAGPRCGIMWIGQSRRPVGVIIRSSLQARDVIASAVAGRHAVFEDRLVVHTHDDALNISGRVIWQYVALPGVEADGNTRGCAILRLSWRRHVAAVCAVR